MSPFISCLVSTLVLGILVIHFSFYIFTVVGTSMLPTFEAGERVLVIRRWPARWLKKNQVVVCNLSNVDTIPGFRPTHVIKRIAGLPKTILKIHFDELEGEMCFVSTLPCDDQGYYAIDIPSKHFFLRTDGSGSDSRHWGPVPAWAIVGVVIMKFQRRAS